MKWIWKIVRATLYKCMEVITQFSKYRGIQGIYAIINVNKMSPKCPNGTPYVGQTVAKPWASKHTLGIGHRLGDHRCRLRKNIHHNPKLQTAWNKYGESSFSYMMLEQVEERENLTPREQFWIDEWDSYKHGYNAAPFAQSGLGLRKGADITEEMIIEWVKQYYDEYGKYPNDHSGKIVYAKEPISWSALTHDLKHGFRGLSGGSSLSKFISQHFNIATIATSKAYTKQQVLLWADEFFNEHGYYPTKRSGLVPYSLRDGYNKISWAAIDVCLRDGMKGFAGGSSLYRLLKKEGQHKLKYQSWYQGG